MVTTRSTERRARDARELLRMRRELVRKEIKLPPPYVLRCKRRPSKKRKSTALGFKLLELPWEIRQIILRDLLWQPEPIHFTWKGPIIPEGEMITMDDPAYEEYWDNVRDCKGEHARKFYPEILSVCEQLYVEGFPILYDNTISCRIYTPDEGCLPKTTMLGVRYSWDSEFRGGDFAAFLPPLVLERMSKAHVEISISAGWPAWRYEDLQSSIHHLVRILRRSSWKNLNIALKIDKGFQGLLPAEFHVNDDNCHYKTDLLKQFLYLRDCKVSITGASSSITEELTDAMTSSAEDRPVVDLDAMLAAIERYVDLVMGDAEESLFWTFGQYDDATENLVDEIDNWLRELDRHRRYVDIKQFLKDRGRLLECVSQYFLYRQQAVFALDPVGTHKPPRSTLRLDDGDEVCQSRLVSDTTGSLPVWGQNIEEIQETWDEATS